MEWLFNYFIPYTDAFPYIGVALVLLLTGVGFPVPEDIILLTAGFVTVEGKANIYLMISVCMMAILGGDFMMYGLGRRFGESVFNLRFFGKIFTPYRVSRIHHFYERHGKKTVFICRFTPGLRAGAYLLAGASRMKAWRFLLMDFLAIIISVPLLVWLGYVLSDQIKEVAHLVSQTKLILFLCILVVILSILLYRRIMLKPQVPLKRDG
ncbi:MAG: DedA family protein [Planctomycetota bacterium]